MSQAGPWGPGRRFLLYSWLKWKPVEGFKCRNDVISFRTGQIYSGFNVESTLRRNGNGRNDDLGVSIYLILMMTVQFSETLKQESIESNQLPSCHIFILRFIFIET